MTNHFLIIIRTCVFLTQIIVIRMYKIQQLNNDYIRYITEVEQYVDMWQVSYASSSDIRNMSASI